VAFLGHVINQHGISVDPKNVASRLTGRESIQLSRYKQIIMKMIDVDKREQDVQNHMI
jgi:hypothetical protein